MSSSQIVLYDLPTRPPRRAWSFNAWKVRLILNFKGLDYRTEWVEYPDIKPTFQDHVRLPEGVEKYTIPTIRLPDGTYIMNTKLIAPYLESQYPTPSIHLDSPYIDRVVEVMIKIVDLSPGVMGIVLPLMPARLLNERAIPFWMETRSQWLGKPIEQMTEDEYGDKAWEPSAPSFQKVTQMLKENEGPFFMGETVSFADFIWAGWLLFWKTLGDDVFSKLISITGDVQGEDNVHLKLLEGVKPWSERNDH